MTLPTTLLSATLGWAAGMRSMTPPAILARALSTHASPVPFLARSRRQPAQALGSDRAASLLSLAATGELVVDKLPVAPPRTSPPALAGRLASGALVGAALAAVRRQNPILPALVGAASAAISSVVMMEARHEVGARFELPDPAVAVLEDVLAVGLSVSVTSAVLD